jgi:hypothetical protein
MKVIKEMVLTMELVEQGVPRRLDDHQELVEQRRLADLE